MPAAIGDCVALERAAKPSLTTEMWAPSPKAQYSVLSLHALIFVQSHPRLSITATLDPVLATQLVFHMTE